MCEVPMRTMKAYRRTRRRALLIHNLGNWWRWVAHLTPWLLYSQGWSFSTHWRES